MSQKPSQKQPIVFEAKTLTISGQQYQTTQSLGQGSFSLAAQGINTQTKEIVVIKETQLSGCSEQEMRQIKREIELFQTLKHPNIVEQYGTEIKDTMQFTVMEPLSKLTDLQINSIPQEKRNEICEKIAIDLLLALEYLSTLGAAHEGVVHRDIKEDNVMIKKDGNNFTTKIIDFNMARIVSGSHYTINAGNEFHRAPECWGNEPNYSTASDLWAVGILLYMLVTQLLPYPDKISQKSVSVSLIKSFQPSKKEFVNGIITKLPSDVPPTLSNLITDLLSNDKATGMQKRIEAMKLFLTSQNNMQKIKSRASDEQFMRLFPSQITYAERISLHGNDLYGIEIKTRINMMQSKYVARDLNCPAKQVEIQSVSILSFQSQLQKIQDELSKIQQFNHPNIIKLYNYFCIGEDLYQVFEKLTPISKLDIQKQKPEIKTMMLMKIAIDLLFAIQFLQSKGIAHGEITKQNVMIQYTENQDFKTKLINYDVLRNILLNNSSTTGQQKYFMPPEYWPAMSTDEGPKIDITTDLWQLGILLYELCSGNEPYPEKLCCTLGKIRPLPADVNPSIKRIIYGLLNITNPQALVQAKGENVIDRANNVSDPQQRIAEMNAFLSCDMNLRFVQQRCSKQFFDKILLLKRQQGKHEEFKEFGKVIKGNNGNQYKIIKTLHTSPASVIYLAQDEKSQNLCAIKKKDLCGLEEPELSQAKNESIILQSMAKQTMLQVIDVVDTEDEQCIVTEFLQPLSELYLKELPENVRNNAIRRIAFDLVMSAKNLSEKRIVHRDVRLANIMANINFGGELIVKLIDFGNAITYDQQNIQEFGVKKFRAPECWGASPQYSYYSDLFAIGIVLLELCNPQLNLRIENKQQSENILNIVQIPQFVSQDIKNLILQLLNPDPKVRSKLVHQFTVSEENKVLFMERTNQNLQ